MEQQKDWTEQLRHRLDNYEAAVPDGLWDNIEAALDKQDACRRKARVIAMRRRVAVAAASVAIVAGSAVYLYLQRDAVDEFDKPMVAKILKQSNDKGVESADIKSDILPKKAMLYAHQIGRKATSLGNSVDLTSAVVAEEELPVMVQGEPETTSAEQHQEEEKKQATTPQKPNRPTYQPTSGEGYVALASRKKGDSRLSFGVSASGIPSSGDSGDAAMVSQDGMSNFVFSSAPTNEFVVRSEYSEKKHHKQPFSVGASVNFGLTDRLSLSSGVVYKQVSTDITQSSYGYDATDTQTLKYVGVPLKANYTAWQSRHLKVYGSLGGQADFNVSAKCSAGSEDYDIKKDRVQFSVSGSVGAQYDLVPQVGVFVEPGVRYYLDNGSSVDNIFKDKPCQLDLQLGVRFNLK